MSTTTLPGTSVSLTDALPSRGATFRAVIDGLAVDLVRQTPGRWWASWRPPEAATDDTVGDEVEDLPQWLGQWLDEVHRLRQLPGSGWDFAGDYLLSPDTVVAVAPEEVADAVTEALLSVSPSLHRAVMKSLVA